MAFRKFIIILVMATTAALASWVLAGRSVTILEGWTKADVARALSEAELSWSEVDANGLQVTLSGAAPEESARFRALEVAGQVVGTSRIQDRITIAQSNEELVPEFQIEILRNGRNMSLIGLMPDRDDRVRVLSALAPLHENGNFSDLMEALDYPAPDGWNDSLNFAVEVLPALTRSTMIVTPGALRIEASLADASTVDKVRSDIRGRKPQNVELELLLSAPKEVLSPFRFEAVADANGTIDITTCHLSNEASLASLDGALRAGDSKVDCVLALGSPSAQWINAVLSGLETLRGMKGGRLVFEDADMTLAGSEALDADRFAKVAEALRAKLPPVFSLEATPADPPFAVNPAQRPDAPRFRAAVDAVEGLVVTGALRDELSRDAAQNYATALFGVSQVDADLILAEEMNFGWTGQVLAALEAASHLHEGVVEVIGAEISVTGVTTQLNAEEQLTKALSKTFDPTMISWDVDHQPERHAEKPLPDARVCERQLATIMRDNTIIFAPNSADISNESELLLDRIAAIISSCENARFEIGGHTDSQGREEMNLGLSQSRADAVLDALLARDVLLDYMIARGYGESAPIAENSTEEGRARNRRIAFRLVPAKSPTALLEENEAENASDGDAQETNQ